MSGATGFSIDLADKEIGTWWKQRTPPRQRRVTSAALTYSLTNLTSKVKEALCVATYGKAGRSRTMSWPIRKGNRRSLSELQGGNAMVLHLSRGGFDPKEHRFLGHLVDVYPDFRNAYTRFVLISTDNQLNINEFRDAVGATWPFLSDPDRMIQRDLEIKEFTDEPHDPMIPHTSPRTGTQDLQGLQRLLVLGPPHDDGAPCGSAGCFSEDSTGFRPGGPGLKA